MPAALGLNVNSERQAGASRLSEVVLLRWERHLRRMASFFEAAGKLLELDIQTEACLSHYDLHQIERLARPEASLAALLVRLSARRISPPDPADAGGRQGQGGVQEQNVGREDRAGDKAGQRTVARPFTMENAAAPYVLFQGVQEDQAVPVFPAVLGLFMHAWLRVVYSANMIHYRLCLAIRAYRLEQNPNIWRSSKQLRLT